MEGREAVSTSNCPHVGPDTPSVTIKRVRRNFPTTLSHDVYPTFPEEGNQWSQESGPGGEMHGFVISSPWRRVSVSHQAKQTCGVARESLTEMSETQERKDGVSPLGFDARETGNLFPL